MLTNWIYILALIAAMNTAQPKAIEPMDAAQPKQTPAPMICFATPPPFPHLPIQDICPVATPHP